jgi:hypothetical protein
MPVPFAILDISPLSKRLKLRKSFLPSRVKSDLCWNKPDTPLNVEPKPRRAALPLPPADFVIVVVVPSQQSV